MSLDFRNTNMLWASVLVETLVQMGARFAVISPGSRSAPLVFALAEHSHLEVLPILDERSAAFFALGHGKRTGSPLPVVCTSGTAGANFYPAVIEAHESQVPLLLLTADRPPELRQCQAGQSIDQVKLYGHYPNWQTELSLPSAENSQLAYLRQMIIHAWERCLWPVAGPVHINIPFRDPLIPVPDQTVQALAQDFDHLQFWSGVSIDSPTVRRCLDPFHWDRWQGEKGVVIAGPTCPEDSQRYCLAVANLSRRLGWPVLADGLSPLRGFHHLLPLLISTYDLILRHSSLAKSLAPDVVIQLGALPTSKALRSWLSQLQPHRWVVDASDRNLDPLHGPTQTLRIRVEDLSMNSPVEKPKNSPYLSTWMAVDARTRHRIETVFADMTYFTEPKLVWFLSQCLPPRTSIFIANSTPVRDVEWFWSPNDREIHPFCNRGANGIDGTLSTALGIAHQHRPTVLLTGDLALLHDSNGFLISPHFQGHLTILLINNQGGGIFEMLPVAEFDPPFETYFATPQQINFAHLCKTHGVEHHALQTWEELRSLLNPLPDRGIRVLEIKTNRKRDATWRKAHLDQLAEA
jgi:2-succinyl-5-enolpyruvyl-6-hydroxy-3-cyclohexene-1-carboxylate synthase